jgi:hypothetical protein
MYAAIPVAHIEKKSVLRLTDGEFFDHRMDCYTALTADFE